MTYVLTSSTYILTSTSFGQLGYKGFKMGLEYHSIPINRPSLEVLDFRHVCLAKWFFAFCIFVSICFVLFFCFYIDKLIYNFLAHMQYKYTIGIKAFVIGISGGFYFFYFLFFFIIIFFFTKERCTCRTYLEDKK